MNIEALKTENQKVKSPALHPH